MNERSANVPCRPVFCGYKISDVGYGCKCRRLPIKSAWKDISREQRCPATKDQTVTSDPRQGACLLSPSPSLIQPLLNQVPKAKNNKDASQKPNVRHCLFPFFLFPTDTDAGSKFPRGFRRGATAHLEVEHLPLFVLNIAPSASLLVVCEFQKCN